MGGGYAELKIEVLMYKQLILASASPRRREILEQAGILFRVQVADFDENKVREELAVVGRQNAPDVAGENDFPTRYVRALALGKAQAVVQENKKNADVQGMIVLGADTVVVHRGEILNKPVDLEDARRMLRRLQGDAHEVYTGVALCKIPEKVLQAPRRGMLEEPVNFAVRTKVVFEPMDEEEIEGYLACGEYADKAGAYAIQGKMAAYIREIHGDYYNVVGLPLSAVVQALKKMESKMHEYAKNCIKIIGT